MTIAVETFTLVKDTKEAVKRGLKKVKKVAGRKRKAKAPKDEGLVQYILSLVVLLREVRALAPRSCHGNPKTVF